MESCADQYVHYLATHMTPRAVIVGEIQTASVADEELSQIRDLLGRNHPYLLPVPYKSIADELCITDQGILPRGNRIVLPAKLRQQAIALAHEDHAGMTRCKQCLRSKLWWSQMEKQVEEHIRCCHPC